ncbi:hypothetical protein GCM10010503_33450 [Streptomyces lucensis JCM 4490]|uniref:Uncharacterized protein n=1 Tax=Streptomyces lucensis JCM 4490 TaxID=1306176 RepID=A0A918J991_9ACTN|nr:DUF5819 family protein [Streptomyces lucensis]GGW53521.1 hypothetical protein GCM10010503_33450 [Streptomyces lucensis JCM 4490]
MDANDEDPGARQGAGAPEPLEPPRPPRPPRPREQPHQPSGASPATSATASTGSTPSSAPVRSSSPVPSSSSVLAVEPDPSGPSAPVGPPRTGVAALSPRYQIGAALALAAVAVAVCVHLLMVFLSLAPANTVTKKHGEAIEEWIYPEFEQNWKLFAPNPLQQNIAVQVRAEVRMKDGALRTTGWTDLSAQDGAAIEGNPVPSHTQQNELRRAWDFFVSTHSTDNRPVALRGALSEQYLRRIVVMRLYRDDPTSKEGVIQRVQVRSSSTNVQPPKWSGERVSDKPVHRVLPWWSVTVDEAAGGVR